MLRSPSSTVRQLISSTIDLASALLKLSGVQVPFILFIYGKIIRIRSKIMTMVAYKVTVCLS